MRRARLTMAALATGAVTLGACGGDDAFPPAAEPADAPPLGERPAGRTVELGSLIEGLAVDPRTGLAAVITRDPVGLALVDPAAGRIERRIPLDGVGRHLQLADPGGPVLVPVEGADQLAEVTLPSGEQTTTGTGDFPHDAATAAGRVFVGDEMGDTITVLEDGELIKILPSPVQPGGVEEGGGFIAVIAVAERVLTTYDPKTLERLGTIPAGEGPTHIAADGTRAFVADTEGDAILEFELGPDPVLVGTTELPGGPYGIALDPRRDLLFATLTASNELVEYAIGVEGISEVARHPTVRQPNTVAVDPWSGLVLVAGKTAEGPLQVIETR